MSITTEDEICLDSSESTDAGEASDVRHNLGRSMGDAASFGVMVGLGETYLPAFALALGMGEASSGLVASLPVVAGGIMQLVSLRAMKFFGDEQRWVVLCASVQALSFIPLIIAALHGSISMPLLLLIASVYWASGLASGPAWNTWMDVDRPCRRPSPIFFPPFKAATNVNAAGAVGQRHVSPSGRQWRVGLAWLCDRCSVAPLLRALSRSLV